MGGIGHKMKVEVKPLTALLSAKSEIKTWNPLYIMQHNTPKTSFICSLRRLNVFCGQLIYSIKENGLERFKMDCVK